MSGYLSLIEFVPGTKAKAQEINENFQAVSIALSEKADKAGNSTQAFNVAAATTSTNAINKSQLDSLSTDLNSKINAAETRFCVKSGNVTNGAGDLLSYSSMSVSFKVGGSYPSLIISNARGTFATFTSVGTLSMSGKPNGAHNVFISTSGNVYSLANNIYKQATRPTLVEGDIWLNTSVEPLKAIKYTSGTDVEFLDIPLGKVTIAGGVITAVETFPYNQNDYDITLNSAIKASTNLAKSITNLPMPNYSSGVSKSWNTSYLAESDGFVMVGCGFGLTFSYSFDGTNWTSNLLFNHSGQGYGAWGFIPIPKGIYYKLNYEYDGSSWKHLKFFPTKGT
ncbi:MAG TPA: hypothetical protein PLG15_05075 [Candidatus Gastranaerophilaceae bacterium]|nr:hypothetical protein [Candidatus Gastranaerophilaceae bacterium]HPT41736.1 hypothetical protein [Candidatus Gastranaerophilaceae bacterium]